MQKKDQLELYHQMVLIRRLEERGAGSRVPAAIFQGCRFSAAGVHRI